MKCLPAIILTFLFLPQLNAQKYFEGVITYAIQYQDIPSTFEGQEDLLPGQLKLYCKDGLYRLEHLGMNEARIQLIDQEEAESILLLDLLGEHIALRTPSNQVEREREACDRMVIRKKSGKVEVAGYNCHQAQVCDAAGKICDSSVAYATALKGTFPEMPAFKGLPLQFKMLKKGISAEYTATAVEQITLERALFSVPEGYALVNTSEMKTIFNSLLPVALEGELE